MSKSELVFNVNDDINQVVKWLREGLQPNQKYLITKKRYTQKRTLDQNAQSHVWYKQIADILTDDNVQGWGRYCKLHHGVPILRYDDLAFKEFYDKALKNNLTYEEKLKAMDFTPVTRLMNTEQFNRYFTALQDDFGNKGVELVFLK